MKIYIGADHRGKALAELLLEWLKSENKDVEFVGNHELDPDDDYVDFAAKVGRSVSSTDESLGVAICGSGVGMDIAANKVPGIRASLGYSVDQVRSGRNDDDINVLAIGSDFIDFAKAKELLRVFLETPFARLDKYTRRIEKIKGLEK